MPGNGNSQVNYQQRKSLKKTISNEQYMLLNQGGPNIGISNSQASGLQFSNVNGIISSNSNNRGNSINSS